MGKAEATSRTPSWLENDQVRFALVLAGVALVATLVILRKQPAGVDVGEPLRAIQHRLKARHLRGALAALNGKCKRQDCDCAAGAVQAGLDVDASAEVLRILRTVEHECTSGAITSGMRAEALVRSRADAAGAELATARLATAPVDPHALCALALVSHHAGALPETTARAERAVDAGRGGAAYLLLGLTHYAANELDAARAAFKAMLESEPDDVDALYNLAVIGQKQDRYGEARTLYLKVLRLDPRHTGARYNLALMAHSIGAIDEANHQLMKLQATSPNDPLVMKLQDALTRAPAIASSRVLTLGAPPSGKSAK